MGGGGAILIAATLLMLLAGCDAPSAAEQPPEPTSEASYEQPLEDVPDEAEPMHREEDLSLSGVLYEFTFYLDGDSITLPITVGALMQYGWEISPFWSIPDTIEGRAALPASFLVRDGVSMGMIRAANFSEDERPLSESVVYGISSDIRRDDDPIIELPRGIVLGESTKDDVLSAFGWPTRMQEPFDEYGGFYRLEYQSESFGLSGGLFGPSANEVVIYASSDLGGLVTRISIENSTPGVGMMNNDIPNTNDAVSMSDNPLVGVWALAVRTNDNMGVVFHENGTGEMTVGEPQTVFTWLSVGDNQILMNGANVEYSIFRDRLTLVIDGNELNFIKAATNDSSSVSSDDPIIGLWEWEQDANLWYEFNADGSATLNFPGNVDEIYWSRNDQGRIVQTSSETGHVSYLNVVVENDVMTLTIESITLILIRR